MNYDVRLLIMICPSFPFRCKLYCTKIIRGCHLSKGCVILATITIKFWRFSSFFFLFLDAKVQEISLSTLRDIMRSICEHDNTLIVILIFSCSEIRVVKYFVCFCSWTYSNANNF